MDDSAAKPKTTQWVTVQGVSGWDYRDDPLLRRLGGRHREAVTHQY